MGKLVARVGPNGVAASGFEPTALTSMSRHRFELDTSLVVGLTLFITAAPLLPEVPALGASVGIALLTAVAWLNRCRVATPLGVLCVVCLALAFSGIRYSQLVLGIGLLGYVFVVRRTPWLEGALTWIRWGTFGTDVRLMTAGCGLIAAVAVWLWYLLLQPNIDDIVQTFVPTAPVVVLVAGGLAFSLINAAVEEGAYRGVIQHALDSALGPGIAALALQAMAFGALHIQGFPRGWVGVALATIYGVLMGSIRRRSDGMLAPWVAHVFTDIVIAGIVVMVGQPSMAPQAAVRLSYLPS
jgi:membrane protease YdiL (CAAX protease family)